MDTAQDTSAIPTTPLSRAGGLLLLIPTATPSAKTISRPLPEPISVAPTHSPKHEPAPKLDPGTQHPHAAHVVRAAALAARTGVRRRPACAPNPARPMAADGAGLEARAREQVA